MGDTKEGLGIGLGNVIGGAISGITNLIGQNSRDKRAMRNQQKLMAIQYANQRNLNQQGHDLQMEAWKKTNYPAQMEMLKEAGLNPALLYGMSSGGGATTGSQGGGNASGGNAPAPQSMEIGTILQGAMMEAQIENIKADTEQKKADAGKKGQETQGLEMANEVMELFGMDADKIEASNRYDKALSTGQIMYEGKNIPRTRFEEQLIAESNQIIDNSEINEATKKAQINEKLYSAIEKEVDIRAKEQGINLSKQQEYQLWHKIRQDWVKAGLQGLDIIVKGRLKDIGKAGK